MAYKTDKIREGSVYRLIPIPRSSNIILQDKGTISAGDGVRYETILGLDIQRMKQTTSAFRLLKAKGVPVAFMEDMGASIFCEAANMIPLEVVVRRAAIGSYLKRFPTVTPHWMTELVVELFHKQTYDARKGEFVDGQVFRKQGSKAIAKLKADGVIFPDPYLLPTTGQWQVHDAADVWVDIQRLCLIPPVLSVEKMAEVEALACRAFKVLEEAITAVDCTKIGIPNCTSLRLADIKFEFGYSEATGALLLCDVVNLDSMRIIINGQLGQGMRHLSKQVFRDGANQKEVLQVYKWGREAFRQFNAKKI